MLDPVVTCDGYSYERCAIEKWFLRSDRSPMTGVRLSNKTLFPNLALRWWLEEMAAEANETEESGVNDASDARETPHASDDDLEPYEGAEQESEMDSLSA